MCPVFCMFRRISRLARDLCILPVDPWIKIRNAFVPHHSSLAPSEAMPRCTVANVRIRLEAASIERSMAAVRKLVKAEQWREASEMW